MCKLLIYESYFLTPLIDQAANDVEFRLGRKYGRHSNVFKNWKLSANNIIRCVNYTMSRETSIPFSIQMNSKEMFPEPEFQDFTAAIWYSNFCKLTCFRINFNTNKKEINFLKVDTISYETHSIELISWLLKWWCSSWDGKRTSSLKFKVWIYYFDLKLGLNEFTSIAGPNMNFASLNSSLWWFKID